MRQETIGMFLPIAMAVAIAGCGASAAEGAESTSAGAAPTGDSNPLQARYGNTPAIEAMEGDATYYADSYEGRTTANGEVYDPRAFTAASPSLPFGTIARVVRVDTGASVIVRVNDRTGGGPTLIDLSRVAAEQLRMIDDGRVSVRLEIVERGE